MRRVLAATLLAVTAGMSAAPASAGCYGVRGWAAACFDGSVVPAVGSWTWCVYTGGEDCENVDHPGPQWPDGLPSNAEVCVLSIPTYCYQ